MPWRLSGADSVPAADDARPRLLLFGSGFEGAATSLVRRRAGNRGRGRVQFGLHDHMPDLYARASCMVLASLATASGACWLGDRPRFFWEEQFGLVLAEAIAAGRPILASRSGAIPEVAGDSAPTSLPGDWMDLARLLAAGPPTSSSDARRAPA